MQDMNDLMERLIEVWAGVRQSVSTMPLISGAGSVPAFKPQEDILNNRRDKISQNV